MNRKVTIFNGFADSYDLIVKVVDGKAVCPTSGVKAEIQEFSFGGAVVIGTLLKIEAKGAQMLFGTPLK